MIADAATDRAHMARALLLAERGRGRTSPNPMVGAVVVDEDGVVVGRGSHEQAGGPHAEIYAFADAGARTRGATLYCTLEPCSHTGRTGPCAPRVVDAGIRRAVIAVEDPNPAVAGRGLAYLRSHGVDVEVGLLREEATRLNQAFFTRMRLGRPFVTMKAALSLDACVAGTRGVRTQLTGPAAGRLVHRERAEVDALAVGSGTVLVDDPQLTVRGVYRHRPLVRVVFDRRLRTPTGATLFTTLATGPVIVMSTAAAAVGAPEAAAALNAVGAQVELVTPDDDSSSGFLRAALTRLSALGVGSLIVEGGPTLHDAFWTAGLVDRVQLFVAAKGVGPDGVPWIALPQGAIAGLQDRTSVPVGDDVLIEGYVHRTD